MQFAIKISETTMKSAYQDVCSIYVPDTQQGQYMIGILNSGEQGTRRAVTPSGKEDTPAEGEKLDPFLEL
jgi:hypothetical protein